MKIAFDERNIEIPFPRKTIYFGEDKQGKAPNASAVWSKKWKSVPKKLRVKSVLKEAMAQDAKF